MRSTNGRSAFRLFSVFDTPVHAEPFFLVLLLLFSYRGFGRSIEEGLIDCLAVVASLLVHEFGHVWAARKDGSRSAVVLGGMGAVTISAGDVHGWRGVRRALAGPFFGLLLFALLWFGLLPPLAREAGLTFDFEAMLSPFEIVVRGGYVEDPSLGHYLWARLVQWNLIWGLFNLLPIPPLDGGHVVDHALESRMRRARALRISSIVGMAFCLALIGFFYLQDMLLLWNVFIVGMLALSNWERLAHTPRV